jgi:hypothetical protein
MASPELALHEGAPDPQDHAPLEGAVRFVEPKERIPAHVELALAGALVVPVPVPRRGRVGETVEEALEGELVARGAVGSAVFAHAYPEDVLSDQLFRARRLGFHGVCISLPSLAAAAAPVGLDPVDAAYLAELAAATRDRPVVLLLDAADEQRGAFATTVPLGQLLAPKPIAPQLVATVQYDPALAHENSAPSAPPISTERLASPTDDETSAEARSFADVGARSVEGSFAVDRCPPEQAAEASAAAQDTAAPELVPAELDVPRVVVDTVLESAAESPAPPSATSPRAEELPWREWVAALRAARGPQPLGAFERLFLQSYLPLATAVDAGLAHPEAVAARDEFRRTFARAYAEACPAFPLTHKRPRMVLDAHDVASRMARLHQARTSQLVLVDGMRFDAGLRLRDLVTDALDGHATLVGQAVLFASLPTVTSRQLEGLARGIDSLRLAHDAERDAETLRARTAEVLRRVKVGSRDVQKLDVIEARVRPSLDVLSELDGAVDAAADAVVKHARGLSGRTLLFVFGDHGFQVERGRATFGGASPEEVIVPGFAWLVGELH